MKEKRHYRFPKGLEDLIFPIAERFLSRQYTTQKMADWVKVELAARESRVKFTRQQIYPVIGEALRRGYLRFHPPVNVHLAQRISDRNQTRPENVCVVNSFGPEGLESVAAAAADLVLTLIRRLALRKRRSKRGRVAIHLGLGAGHTGMLVSRSLAHLLRSVREIEGVSKLVLHAMSSGFTLPGPLRSPGEFFSYFSETHIPIEYLGLFSTPMVPCKGYETTKKLPGVKQALKRSSEIDIVITSLGSADDSSSLLSRVEEEYSDGRQRPKLRRNEPVRLGDVQFRPFSKEGPLADDPRWIRAVTLFELSDFVTMAKQEDRYVILVSGTKMDGTTKARPLVSLLTKPNLRVWSHLCLDVQTAREVVDIQDPASAKPDAAER